jgi:hypothetical protein
MPDRLTILKAELDLHLDAAYATIMEMRKEATKLADVSTSAIPTGALTDEQIFKALSRRERTIQKKQNKHS